MKAVLVKYPNPKTRVKARLYLSTIAVKYGAFWLIPSCTSLADEVLKKLRQLGVEIKEIELDIPPGELREYLLARLKTLERSRTNTAKAEERVVRCALAALAHV